jgi:hypothetical protein
MAKTTSVRGTHTDPLRREKVVRKIYIAVVAILAAWLTTPAWGAVFTFSTGNPDGKLGALSQQASSQNLETETADDFILSNATVINSATITGLIPAGTSLASITNVEVELYHVFPKDSVNPPSGKVPTRVNSPADVEIGVATRDGSDGTLAFIQSLVNPSVTVTNTVVNRLQPQAGSDGSVTGEEVQIAITFTPPIFLPADHYFFRPEAALTSGDFLYLSAPRPTNPPIFTGDSPPQLPMAGVFLFIAPAAGPAAYRRPARVTHRAVFRDPYISALALKRGAYRAST